MVTLKEIAKRTGVAESTISRVLNRDPSLSISDHKRRLVVETAESLQYVPRRARTGLSDKNTDRSIELRKPGELKSVVMLHFLSSQDELSRPFFVGLRKGIEARAEAYGLAVTRAFAGEFDATHLHKVRNQGVIFVGDPPDGLIEEVAALDIPLVLAHPEEKHEGVDIAYADVAAATERLVAWLRSAGRTQIAMLGISETSTARLSGYRKEMEKDGLFDLDYISFTHDEALGDGVQQTQELYARLLAAGKPDPEAIITFADIMVPGVYQALIARGLAIPDDVEVLSINDSSIAQVLSPELTTVRLEAGAIGETAIDLLIERQGGRTACKHVEILSTLQPRKSTRPDLT